MKYALVAAIVLLNWGQPAFGLPEYAKGYLDTRGRNVIVGLGMLRCFALEKHKPGGASQAELKGWILGCITMSNIHNNGVFSKTVIPEGILVNNYFRIKEVMGMVYGYCEENPREEIHGVMGKLESYLRTKK